MFCSTILRKDGWAVQQRLLQQSTTRHCLWAQSRGWYRVGDTYPNQMLQVQMRAYFYRWKSHTTLEGEEWPFTAWELKITDGLMSANQLLLRMPTTMVHVIDDDSPLAAWRTGRAAVATDSDSEIVVMVSCYSLEATEPGCLHALLIDDTKDLVAQTVCFTLEIHLPIVFVATACILSEPLCP